MPSGSCSDSANDQPNLNHGELIRTGKRMGNKNTRKKETNDNFDTVKSLCRALFIVTIDKQQNNKIEATQKKGNYGEKKNKDQREKKERSVPFACVIELIFLQLRPKSVQKHIIEGQRNEAKRQAHFGDFVAEKWDNQ